MSDREPDEVTLDVVEREPARNMQVFCVFCCKKSTKNNIRRHCNAEHPDSSAGEDLPILFYSQLT